MKRFTSKFICQFLLVLSFSALGQKRVYFGFDADLSSEISLFENGNYALGAASNFNGSNAALLMFFDACGDTLWSKTFFEGLDLNRLIRIQNDNEFIWLAAGLGSNQDSAIALIKLNQQGQVLLSKSITAPINFVWYQFHIDLDGNLYFTGNATSTGGYSNTILKLNPQGQQIHAFQYGSIFIWGMSIPSPSGGLLNTTGRTLYKVDGSGNIEWIKTLQNYQQSQIPPIALPDGYLIFHKYIGALDRTGLLKIDLQGNLLWFTDNYLHINASSATVDQNRHILLSYTDYGPTGINLGILELDENGSYLNAHLLPIITGDFISDRDLKIIGSDKMLIHGLIDYNFANYQALSLRTLPRNLDALNFCPATLTTLDTDPSYLVVDTLIPNLNPSPYAGFSVQNFSFPQQNPILTENIYCTVADPSLTFDLGGDSVICKDDSLYLKPNLPLDEYNITWSTGDQSDSILVEQEGLIWCEVSSICGSGVFRDSIFISYYPSINFTATYSPETPALGDSISFVASPPLAGIYWTIGDSSFFTNPLEIRSFSEMSEGVVLNYVDSNGCLSGDTLYPVFSDLELMLPNAFTPNGDGLNDVFGPDPNRLFYYELQVFDRFGKLQAQLVKSQWDGSNLPSGSYVYLFKYQLSSTSEERVLRGIVNLIR